MFDVIRRLDAAVAGDRQAAADLWPLVYDELPALAAARMTAASPGHTRNATALVHEAVCGGGGEERTVAGKGTRGTPRNGGRIGRFLS